MGTYPGLYAVREEDPAPALQIFASFEDSLYGFRVSCGALKLLTHACGLVWEHLASVHSGGTWDFNHPHTYFLPAATARDKCKFKEVQDMLSSKLNTN